MKKIIMLVLFAAISIPVTAQAAPQGGPGGGRLTEEQKACLKAANCPQPAKPKLQGQPGKRPQMSESDMAAMKEARECRQKAYADCGIQMPKRTEGGKPGGKDKASGKGKHKDKITK